MITTQPPPPEGKIPPEGDTLVPPLRVYCDPGESVDQCASRLFGAGVLVCDPRRAEELSRRDSPRVAVGEVSAHRSDPGYTVLAPASAVTAVVAKGAYPTYTRMHPATARAAMATGMADILWFVRDEHSPRRVVITRAIHHGWAVAVWDEEPPPRTSAGPFQSAFKEAMYEIEGAQS